MTNATEFKINTGSFPMVFAGTRGQSEPAYLEPGYYDPTYPPKGVDLHWWYQEWPTNRLEPLGSYAGHVGEYIGSFADEMYVNFTWTDYRIPAVGSLVAREQSDIRFVRLPWP